MRNEFEPKIATGYEKMALDLESHMHNFIPTSWVEHIGKAAHPPMLLAEDAENLARLAKNGTLEKQLEIYGGGVFNRPYLIEAIMDFFKKGKTSK